jgi:uncharacterized protein YneF (UPF0154 family)
MGTQIAIGVIVATASIFCFLFGTLFGFLLGSKLSQGFLKKNPLKPLSVKKNPSEGKMPFTYNAQDGDVMCNLCPRIYKDSDISACHCEEPGCGIAKAGALERALKREAASNLHIQSDKAPPSGRVLKAPDKL